MAELYDDIRWCETAERWYCNLLEPLAYAILNHVRSYYPALPSYHLCPPGDPPAPPGRVHAGLAQTDYYKTLTVQDDDDVRVYIAERFEIARAAYNGRIDFCQKGPGQPQPPPSPGAPPPSKPPEAPPKGTAPPIDDNGKPKEAAGVGIGVLAILAGAAMLLASRRR